MAVRALVNHAQDAHTTLNLNHPSELLRHQPTSNEFRYLTVIQ